MRRPCRICPTRHLQEVEASWLSTYTAAAASLGDAGVSLRVWRPHEGVLHGIGGGASGSTLSPNWRAASRGEPLPPRPTRPPPALPADLQPGALPAATSGSLISALASSEGAPPETSWVPLVRLSEAEAAAALSAYLAPRIPAGCPVSAAADAADEERPGTSFAALFAPALSLGLLSPRFVLAAAAAAAARGANAFWDPDGVRQRHRAAAAAEAVTAAAFHKALAAVDLTRAVGTDAPVAAGGLQAGGLSPVTRYFLWRGHLVPYVHAPCVIADAPHVLLVHGAQD